MQRSSRLIIPEPNTKTRGKGASLDRDLEDAIREYLRTYILWRGTQAISREIFCNRPLAYSSVASSPSHSENE